jgi:hypothetical protein
MTLGGFTYPVNVTTYANVSSDVRDIIVSFVRTCPWLE